MVLNEINFLHITTCDKRNIEGILEMEERPLKLPDNFVIGHKFDTRVSIASAKSSDIN